MSIFFMFSKSCTYFFFWNNKAYVEGITFNLQKAYDSVNHDLYRKFMELLAIVALIKSYPTNKIIFY
jgi:hypothetical protein